MGNANVVSQGEEGQCQTFSRKKVEISSDCWLDVLKFLTCAEWSEKRYVSRQISGVAARNFSRLPRATIEKAILNEECSKHQLLRELPNVKDAIVAFDVILPHNKIAQWFVKRGINLEYRAKFHSASTQISPEAILIDEAFFGKHSYFTDMCILGPAQQHVQKSWFGYLFRKQESLESVVFYSQFRPRMKFARASLEQFFTFLFHPLSYIKVVEMFAVNQKFVDAVKENFADNYPILRDAAKTMHPQNSNDNKPPYIHCETFSLLYTRDIDVDGLCNTLSWLERNVRADSIRMPFVSAYTHFQDYDALCHLLNNFVFGALRICAKRELRIHSESCSCNLFFSVAKKFWTLPRIESEIPTIVIEPFPSYCFPQIQWALRSNVIHQEMDSQGAEFLYVIENEHNRMRISFRESPSSPLPYDWAKEYLCYVKFHAK
ncbi:hypothetical protein Ddc_13631 [Ditylenchus destructor]|nr:hypothetical protein Ddc_13631 [Ditylenchus destructor]